VIQTGVVGGPKVMQPGTPFQANGDWLKNMSIVLKNRTNKTIEWALIYIYFPDTGDGITQTESLYSIQIGQMPAVDFFTGKGGKVLPHHPGGSPLSFAPGQTLVIKIADHLDEMQSIIEAKLPLEQVTRIAIEPNAFFFEDGMRWDTINRFGTADPNQPGKFTNLDKGRYFPGDPWQNWPPAAAPSQE
jgi:hypothetical protein